MRVYQDLLNTLQRHCLWQEWNLMYFQPDNKSRPAPVIYTAVTLSMTRPDAISAIHKE